MARAGWPPGAPAALTLTAPAPISPRRPCTLLCLPTPRQPRPRPAPAPGPRGPTSTPPVSGPRPHPHPATAEPRLHPTLERGPPLPTLRAFQAPPTPLPHSLALPLPPCSRKGSLHAPPRSNPAPPLPRAPPLALRAESRPACAPPTPPLTQGLEQQRAVEGEDERRQVLQAHHCNVAVDPHHLVGRHSDYSAGPSGLWGTPCPRNRGPCCLSPKFGLRQGLPYPPLDLTGLDAACLPPQLLHAGLGQAQISL